MFTARVKRSVTPILKKIDVLTALNIKAQCNLLQQVTMMSFNQQYSIKNFYFDINQLNNRTLYLIKHIVKSIFNEMFASNIKSNNWPKVVFKDIFKKESYKVNIPSNENGIYWLLNLDAIEPNSGNVIFKKYVRDSEIGVSTFKFEPNCILYSKLRPYLNKVIISDDYGFATSELIPLKCNNKQLNIIYAVNLLRSSKFVSYIQEHVAGVKMPRVQMDKFWNYQICLPPVE